MATSFVQAGSPLDDYFRDEVEMLKDEKHHDHSNAALDAPWPHTSDDRRHPDVSPQKGWTGNIPNFASSSRSPFNIRPAEAQDDLAVQLEARPEKPEEVEAFAERFKYLICSSGLLEKDHVPCLGARSRGHRDRGTDREDVNLDLDPDPDGPRDTSTVTTKDRSLVYYLLLAQRHARLRPDIALACAVLLGAVSWVAGWRLVLTVLAIAITLVPVFRLGRRRNRSPLNGDLGGVPDEVKQDDLSSIPAGPQEDGYRGAVMTSLNDLLDTSQSLDHTVEASLSLLSADTDSLETHQPLRLALHRLNEQSADHLGSATSTLLEMVDKDELGVLGEMYDIPVVGSFFYPRRRRSAAASRAGDDADDSLHLPSPKRLSWNASKPLLPLSLPMGTSASMPSRLTPGKKHTAHQSLSGLPPDDRYTSIPRRTPRKSKRSSWAPEWNDRIKFSDDAQGPDMVNQHDASQEMSRNSSSDGDRSRDAPVTPVVPLYTPRRSSPLSRSGFDSGEMDNEPKRHIFPIIPPTPLKSPVHSLQPSPMAKSPTTVQAKRQSLQSMPYYRSDQSDIASPGKASVSVHGSIDFGRAQSLQYSDLQSLRDQSTHGSRRSSVSASIGLGIPAPLLPSMSPIKPRPTVQRVPSLSPLTLMGLRAACLGIHMKRRRMACCLLGLRFGDDDEYWAVVQDVLDQMSSNFSRDVADLVAALDEAKTTQPSQLPPPATNKAPPWLHDESALGPRGDFAPRTSDHARLNDHIQTMERSLHDAWTKLQAVKTKREGDLPTAWTDVRSELGLLIRDWERGKETVNKLAPPVAQASEHLGEDGTADENPTRLPAFMQAWDDDDPEPALDRSLSTVSPISDSPAEHPIEQDRFGNEVLPPPGQDMVFESLPVVGEPGKDRSKLSREERIKLMKEARDQGMTLGELLSARNDPDKVENRKVLAMGGEVVAELNGMIGMIRRRKGIPAQSGDRQDNSPTSSRPSSMAAVKQYARPSVPPGLADELKKAFVFPTPTPRVNGNSDH